MPHGPTFDPAPLAFGAASAALTALAFVLYIRGTLQRRTVPVRSSWLIWSILGAVSLSAMAADGGRLSLIFVAAQWIGTVIVLILALAMGRGALLRGGDGWALGASAAGLGLWWATTDPAWALAISLGISAIGGLATIARCAVDPGGESVGTWAVFLASAVVALGAVPGMEPMQIAHPIFLSVLYAAILGATLAARARSRRRAPHSHL
jgi:hypothetical protein